MARLHPMRTHMLLKPACIVEVEESRSTINIINFPFGGHGAARSFTPPATRAALTLVRLPAIGAA